MDTLAWVRLVAVFLTASGAVVLLAWVWERQQQRRRTRRTLGAVTRATDRFGAVAQRSTAPLLREEDPAGGAAGALERLPGLRSVPGLLEQADVSWGMRGFLVRAVAAGVLLTLVVALPTGAWALAPLTLLAGALLPVLLLRRARARRVAAFEDQFPDAVDLLARAIRAGHPFTAGLKMVSEESPEPLAGEFRRVFEEQKFGLSLHESLEGMAERVGLLDVRLFVTAILIQREVGGNLAEILDQISETIRERMKILRQVRVYTAQGRLTGILLSLLPVGLGLLLTVINPNYMMVLFTEPVGRAMLGGAAVLQLIGYGLIRRITTIEV